MASTILAKDVLYRASVQLLDVPNGTLQFKRFTERELLAWLNDGQRVIAKYLPSSCARIDAVKLAAGTRQSISSVAAASIIPGDGSAASTRRGSQLLDVIRNMGSNGATPGVPIRAVSREVLDTFSPGWHSVTAAAVTEFVFDPRQPTSFYVSPGVPAATAVWVELSWVTLPAEIPYAAGSMVFDTGTSTVTISIDDQFVDDLVNYIVARAMMKDAEVVGNLQLAAGYVNLFTSSINAQAQALTGVNPNLAMLPFAAQPLIGQAH